MKNKKFNKWLWKWHFIAGIISMPFVLILSITGAIYLFKDKVETPRIAQIQMVQKEDGNRRLSYQEQYEIAASQSKKPLSAMVVSENKEQATEYTVI